MASEQNKQQQHENNPAQDAAVNEENFKSWNTRDALDESNLAAINQTTNDVATNDGSTIETLDTAFHDKPGYAEGQTVSGSNRADYYEARSDGKTDAEEELEVMKAKQKQ